MKKLIFIGPLNYGQQATCGETIKNQLFLGHIEKFYDRVMILDTTNWRKHPFILLKLMFVALFIRKTPIMISICTSSAARFITLLSICRNLKNVHYFVIASNIVNMINEGLIKVEYYSNLAKLKSILVETKNLYSELSNQGLSNVRYLPNLKDIPVFERGKKVNNADHTRFVFLSRIEKMKGVDLLFDAVEILNKKYKDKFILDFYGRVEPSYEKNFYARIADFSNLNYCGFLQINKQGYEVLNCYHVMVFPTIYQSEGFPGIIIDAFIAGLPLIASEGQYSKDLLEQYQTSLNVPRNDLNCLLAEMENVIIHKYDIPKMSEKCILESHKYDINKVLTFEFLQGIGML